MAFLSVSVGMQPEVPRHPPKHVPCNLRCSTVPVALSSAGTDGGPERTGTRVQPAEDTDAGDPFDPEDNGPYQVHGIAIPEDGLTFGKDEEWTFWPEQTARDAEGLLSGRNIIDLHPENPTNDDVIGEVTGELYISGLGLSWTGEVDSRKRAKQIHRGRLDSSPYLYAYDGGDSDALPANAPEGTRVASGVSNIRDIGMVPDGAIANSEVQAGVHPEIEGETALQAALSEGFGETDKPGGSESGGMSDEEQDTIEELKSRISDLEDENDTLEEQLGILRKPYLEAVTEGSDLSPEQVNMDAEQLAEHFSGDGSGGNGDGSSSGTETPEGTTGSDAGGEGDEATALSAAPLTAARGSSPGEGSAKALSEGSGGGSGGENGGPSVEVPDESLEVLEERRRLAGGRTTSEHTDMLDKQIEAKRQAEGS